jgi:alpha-tubulin suppressor-like RCC1 family protein
MVSTKMLAVTTLGAAALFSSLSLSPALAQPGSGTVDHWGAYAGSGGTLLLRPVSVSLPSPVAEVGSSNSTEYALLDDGTLYAWGGGSEGQLGNGTTKSSFTNPVQVRFPPGVRIASIPTDVMPFDTGLAIDTNGHVWGWGFNKNGELCLGNTQLHTTPVQLPFNNVSMVAGAGAHATYDAGGTLFSCGSGRYGELGDGKLNNSSKAVRVQGLSGSTVSTLVASYGNTGALLKNGEYFDWGLDSEGQLGNGTIGQDSAVPVQVALPTSVSQVAEGGSLPGNGQTLVMLSDGSLRSWGDDQFFQLGNDRQGVFPSPVQFFPPNGVTYSALATSGATSYALSTRGVVYAWGNNKAGQVGDGTRTIAQQPEAVDFGAFGISATANDVEVNVFGHPGGAAKS